MMKPWLSHLLLICAGLAVSCQKEASPSKITAPNVYHRVEQVGDSLALDTASVELALEDGRTVTLVSVIHIAEKSYYHKLNQQLAQYDLVLYELLGKGLHTILPPYPRSRRDEVLEKRLGLFYQTAEIDYSHGNFLHADLTKEALGKFSDLRPEPPSKRLFEILAGQETRQARQQALLAELDTLTAIIGGAKHGAEFAEARHQSVMAKLETPKGKAAQNVAILYGSYHMPQIIKKLPRHTVRAIEWKRAWSMPGP